MNFGCFIFDGETRRRKNIVRQLLKDIHLSGAQSLRKWIKRKRNK